MLTRLDIMATSFLGALDFIVNALNASFSLARGNLPGIIAFSSAAAATSSEFFSTSFEITASLATKLLEGTQGMGPIHNFLQGVVDFLGGFAYAWFPKINAYFPLDFAITSLCIYLGMVATGAIVRSIKSFVPTVA